MGVRCMRFCSFVVYVVEGESLHLKAGFGSCSPQGFVQLRRVGMCCRKTVLDSFAGAKLKN